MKVIKNTLFVLLLLFILLTVTVIYADDTDNINFKTNNSTDNVENIGSTYSDLQNNINQADSNLNLTQNHKFEPEIDANLIDGVRISKSMNIVGKSDIYIDGANTARGLYIGSNCNVVLENLVFKNGYATGNGGGIYLSSNSNLTLINCVFENNYAYNCDGAAVNANSQTNLEIRNCEFINNTCVRESDLEWSQFKCGMGSGVCIDIGSTLRVYNSIFKENIAHMATILVISYDDKNYKLSKLFMNNCSFESNCVKDCGIIYLDEMGEGEIHNSTFKNNNITHYGGILELDACLSALVKNCQFLENNGHIGGAIHVKVFNDNYVSNVCVQDCNFTKNKASVSGGGIYSNCGNVSLYNCIFNQNSASEKAGAVYSKKSTMNIVNCYFNQNSASEKGGSIYSNNATMNIFNSNFNQNTAQDKGGGVCAFYSDLHVSQSNFNQNTASDKGGAIYSNTGLISVDKSQFSRNSANRGGAVYEGDSSLSIISSQFNQNKAFNKGGALFSLADKFISYGCSYSLNSALNGQNIYGAFYVSIKQYAISSKSTALKIKLSSPWKMSLSQKIKIKVTGSKSVSSKWVSTNSKGEATLIIPYKIKTGKSKLEISMKSGVGYVKSWTKVKESAKIKSPKKVKKSSKLKVKVLAKHSKNPIIKTKFKVKVSGKTYNLKTDSKGFLKIKTNNLSKGVKKFNILLKNSDFNIKNKFSVKIK